MELAAAGGLPDTRRLLLLQASHLLSHQDSTPFTTHASSVEAATRLHRYVMQYLGECERITPDAMGHICACQEGEDEARWRALLGLGAMAHVEQLPRPLQSAATGLLAIKSAHQAGRIRSGCGKQPSRRARGEQAPWVGLLS